MYTLVCFTFNTEVPSIIKGKLLLRNNWVDENVKQENLPEMLESLGFKYDKIQNILFEIATKKVVKETSDFTIANTKIIVHVIKN